jgi:hypothetical protein
VVVVILTLSASFIATEMIGGREGMRYTGRRNDWLISYESEEKGITL